jgi:hypothetical protein
MTSRAGSANVCAPEGQDQVRRPPLFVVFVAVFVIALGETAGAVMSALRPQIDAYARARVAANPGAHGLAGTAEYDVEVTGRAVFAAEAGLSFFHTHAEGLAPIVLLATTVVATLVPSRRARGSLYALFAVGGLFPLGYLVYAVAVLEAGRDTGIELAERYVLTPLGSAALVAVLVLAVILAGRRRSTPAG